MRQIKERGALPALIVVISVRQSTVAAISGLLPGAGYGQFEHKADSLILKFKEAGERSERLMYEQESRIISTLVICIIVCLSWAVNHYVITPLPTKAQRDKNAGELKLANAAITDVQVVSVMLLRSMPKPRRNWLKC